MLSPFAPFILVLLATLLSERGSKKIRSSAFSILAQGIPGVTVEKLVQDLERKLAKLGQLRFLKLDQEARSQRLHVKLTV
jgi:hypothetical protein